MTRRTRPGVVIFTGDKDRLAEFYEALTGLQVRGSNGSVTVLASDDNFVRAVVPEEQTRDIFYNNAVRFFRLDGK